ncbi:MAG: ABC transporter substrate-binding protein [Treponema sp.]|jgi:peptide/nickel transport system substrate-binding protein|nr:ABC transporter substrate-binding protein [Treponema sp.]
MKRQNHLFSPVKIILALTLLFSAAGTRGVFAEGVFAREQKREKQVLGGGELRFGITSELTTLDPLSPSNTADGRSVLFNVYEGLVKSDTEGNLVPAVAEAFGTEQNGLVYSFILRKGVRFHDGSPVTPADVEFTLNTAIEKKFSGFTGIDKVEISGEQDLRITLKSPDVEFLPYLTIGIVPKANADREKNPIGTGPFKIESYTPQQSLVLVKNPGYWRGDIPKLDKVTVVFGADSDSLLTGLIGGNIDAAGVTGSVLEQLDRNRFTVVEGYSNTVQLFALNNSVKPLDNTAVRQAVSYAVDPAEIIDTAFYGWGEPSGSPLIPGLKNYYESSLRNPYPKDTGKAKALLAAAGYRDGFPLEITVPSNYTMHVDTAQVIVNQLAEVGIKAAIRLTDWSTWLSDVYRGRKFEATIISFDGSSVPLSPRSFLGRYVSTSGSNFINFNNSEYDRLYNAALTESDGARRTALYKRAQRVISEYAASVYIQDIMSFKVFAPGFAGAVNYPLHVVDFSTIYRTD